MKINKFKNYFLLVTVVVITISACKKYHGDTYDFSETAENYVRLTPGGIEFNDDTKDTTIQINGKDTTGYHFVVDDEPRSIDVESRVGLNSPVVYTIEYTTPTGNKTLQITQPAFATSASADLSLSDIGTINFATTDTTYEGTITIKSINNSNLVLGYPLGKNVTIPYMVYNPDIVYFDEEGE